MTGGFIQLLCSSVQDRGLPSLSLREMSSRHVAGVDNGLIMLCSLLNNLLPAPSVAYQSYNLRQRRRKMELSNKTYQLVDNKLCGSRHNMPPALVTVTFDLESGVRVTCDVGYHCANFSLPRPLCSDLGPMYATDRRQTDRRLTASFLNIPA